MLCSLRSCFQIPADASWSQSCIWCSLHLSIQTRDDQQSSFNMSSVSDQECTTWPDTNTNGIHCEQLIKLEGIFPWVRATGEVYRYREEASFVGEWPLAAKFPLTYVCMEDSWGRESLTDLKCSWHQMDAEEYIGGNCLVICHIVTCRVASVRHGFKPYRINNVSVNSNNTVFTRCAALLI